MKKLLIVLSALLAMPLFAGDPEFHGNFLAALEEDNSRIRAGMIVSALEAAKSKHCDKNALDILCYDLENDGFDRPLLLRLTALMKKNPDDIYLASLVFAIGNYWDFCPEELIEAFAQTVMSAQYKQLSRSEQVEISNLLEELNIRLLATGKFELDQKTFDHLLADAESPEMLEKLAVWSGRSIFHIYDTAPGFNGYAQLPDNNPWKARQHLLAGIIAGTPANSPADAGKIISAMTVLRMPQTPEQLRKFKKFFPDSNWEHYSIMVANTFKRPDLLKLIINSGYTFKLACEMKQYRAAKRWIRKQKRSERAKWMAYYYSVRKEYHQVISMLDSGEIELKNIDIFFLEAVGNAIHFTKSEAWCKKLLTEAERQGKECLPVIANSVGYIAADLNIELDRAEKLIRLAADAYPANSSYRDSLAWVLYRQGRFAEASQQITTALAYRIPDKGTSIIFFHAAEIQLALGNKVQARQMFDRAIKIYDAPSTECSDYSHEKIKNLEQRLK